MIYAKNAPFALVAATLCAGSLLAAATPARSTDDEEPHDHADDLAMEELFVTAAPHSQRRFDVIQGTSVLEGEALQSSIRGTIGETLAQEPGISSSYFGPGASRPIIRGLDGPRVRVLMNGIGAIDASSTSPDHAVAGEPLLAERIEVVRGAGTLLYGSSAIGGVVNIQDGRIPSRLPEDGLDGAVVGTFASAAAEKSIAGALTAGVGPVALRAEGAFRDANLLDIPGFALSEPLRRAEQSLHPDDFDPGPFGRVPNTDLRNTSGTFGASVIGEVGHFGVAYGLIRDDYGVPGGAHGHEGEEDAEEAPVRIDLEQDRVDFGGELLREWGIFESTWLRVGYAEYEHTELEGGEVGTVFENAGWEGRLDLVQRPFGDLDGSLGFQFVTRDFEAVGEEAFTPPSETRQFALFAVEEVHWDPVTLEAGLRYEHTRVDARRSDGKRRFDSFSFSVGAGWAPNDDYLFGVSLSRTERPPTAEELYSFGPHLATGGFEIGNADFDEEAGLTVEVTARRRHGHLTSSVNVFYTWFDDFIFQRLSGEEMDGLPVRRFVQDDAEFVGGEFEVTVEAFSLGYLTGLVDVGLDYVHAREKQSHDPLARIPPFSLFGGVGVQSEYIDGRFEARWVRRQDRVADDELPTASHLLLNLRLALRPLPEHDVTLTFDASNLLDRDARNHASFVKDRVPLPGRDFRLALRMDF